MRIAVLSLTRDRLPYTKVCFASLRENAGCDYDHLVFDQGSADGTSEWLSREYTPRLCRFENENVGIHVAMNRLIEMSLSLGGYDLLVQMDNDCEVVTPGTLKAVAEHTLASDVPLVLSPLILGLRSRPPIIQTVGRIGKTRVVGGIFRSIPPQLLEQGFRFDESMPVWGGDEQHIAEAAYRMGGWCGYMLDYEARHYLTTDGQAADIPDYFRRRAEEGGPAI